MDATWERLSGVFRKVFRNPDLNLTRETSAWDIEGWDSLAHMQVVLAVEEEFAVQFATKDVIALEKVGDLYDLIQRTRPSHT